MTTPPTPTWSRSISARCAPSWATRRASSSRRYAAWAIHCEANMRLLRSLPIRWQITVLHATILALVLAAGGAGLWNAQRTFQRDNLLARQLTELRTIIPEELDPKLATGLYMAQKPAPATLKAFYATIVAALLAPGADPGLVRKRIAMLDPKLADQAFPPGAALPPRDEMEKIVSKLVFELFPPDADPLETRK